MKKNGGVNLNKMLQNQSLMSVEQQAYELMRTVRCKLGQSKIHGVGVITLRDIKKGEPLFCSLKVKPQWYNMSYNDLSKWFDKTYPEIKQIIVERWPHIVNNKIMFISPNYDARLTSFMNHSDIPNYDPVTDTALEDIARGEEVLEDYRVIPNYEVAFPFLAKEEK